MSRSRSALTVVYQSALLEAYAERLIYGFTGKDASFGGPDTPRNPRTKVLENRQALLAEYDMPPVSSWIIPTQVHGHRIGRTGDCQFDATDGVVLYSPNQPVMLLFADCVPLLFYDPVRHAGAVVHAGWRGTTQHIAREAIITLKNAVGSEPADLVVAIGPSIGLCCFQVSLEVAQQIGNTLSMTLPEMEAKGFLTWDAQYPQNPRLDLKAINRYQLDQAGVGQIEVLAQCTRCLEDELFSYRRGEDGRNCAFMMLR